MELFRSELVRQISPEKIDLILSTFTLVGFLWISKTFLCKTHELLTGIRVLVLSRFWPIDLRKRYGQWVVITGATDGVGLSYAREFARRKHSLVLLGRNQEKLDRVKLELKKHIPQEQIVLICADLSTATLETYKEIARKIKCMERDVGILFNNAGVAMSSACEFLDQPDESVQQHVSVNISAVLMITRCVLPGMCKRKRGLIINMSSISAVYPMPGLNVYAASKKFVEYFSKSLEFEYKSHGIEVQTLMPSFISTKMVKSLRALSEPSLLSPSGDTFARAAIATIGRSSDTTGFWSHGLQFWCKAHLLTEGVWKYWSLPALKAIDTSTRRRSR